MRLFDPSRPKWHDFPALLDQRGNIIGHIPWPTISAKPPSGTLLEVRVYLPSASRSASYRCLACEVPLDGLQLFFVAYLDNPEGLLAAAFKYDFAAPTGRRAKSAEELADELGL